MEKKLMWLAVIIILALGITYATLYIGYDFHWWDGNGIRLLVRVTERTNRAMTNIEQSNRKQW